MYTIKGKTDGFGAQYQSIMSGIAICEYNKCTYLHTPFVKMEHDVNINELNAFIGINNNALNEDDFKIRNDIVVEEYSRVVHNSATPSIYYTGAVIKKIRDFYYSTEKPKLPDVDIAIHIRRGDVGSGNIRYTGNNIYACIINSLKLKYPTYNILIFSEGNIDDFKEFGLDKEHFRLNEDIITTFHSLVCAKILIMSRSCFSYTSAILNENTVYYLDFWHKSLDNWLNVNSLIHS
jgi:hypothetical protein